MMRGGARRRAARRGRLVACRRPAFAKDDKQQEKAEAEAEAERKRCEQEDQMHTLASADREEDYRAAAKIRDKLSVESLEDDAKVLATIQKFYQALSGKDLKGLESLWLDASHVRCLHPGEDWTVGYEQVTKSWGKLFKRRDFLDGHLQVEGVRMNVRGAAATVVCRERLRSSPGGRTVETYNATHVLQKAGGHWMVVLRHVSTSHDDMLGAAGAIRKAAMSSGGQNMIIMPGNSYDDDDEDEEQVVRSMFQFMVSQHEDDGSEHEMETNAEPDSDSDIELLEQDPLDDARAAVRALRRLSAESRLSSEARIHLIQEMLWNPGESAPERAYELLLKGVPDEEQEEAWEDFADLVCMEAERLMSSRPAEGRGRRKASF